MRRGSAGAASLALFFALAGLLFLGRAAGAQEQRDCADFDTQEEAQRFYDAQPENQDSDPNNDDPQQLDTDGDKVACEGLPTSAAQATGSPAASPAATAAATASPDRSIPNNGAGTGIMALSGLSLLELGYGLTLASKKLNVRRRSVPLYLLHKMLGMARRGEDRVEVADDFYLVHRSALEKVPPVLEESDAEPMSLDDFLADDAVDALYELDDDAEFDIDDEADVDAEIVDEIEWADDEEDEEAELIVEDADVIEDVFEIETNGHRPSAPSVYAAIARRDASLN